MEAKKQLTGLRKRQQIAEANKTMFMWVVIAAVAVSICFVAGQYLLEQGMFNQKIINAKSKAAATLRNNIETAEELKTNVNALVGNAQLSSAKAYEDESNLQVVLDALPTKNDSAALAASLQLRVLEESGVTITSLSADESSTLDDDEPSSSGAIGEQDFTFEIEGSFDQILNALKDIERTIRPLHITSVSFQGSDDSLRATASGVTYYQPAKTVQVQTETIKP